MRHCARTLALAACLTLTGSIAEAAPARQVARHSKLGKKAKHRAKIAPPVDQPDASEEDRSGDDAPAIDPDSGSEAAHTTRSTHKAGRKRARTARPHDEGESDSAPAAFASSDSDRGVPVTLHKRDATRARDWHVAIGPYLWASSVDANVSLGSASVNAGTDFLQTAKHARYGAEVLADARYRRFSLSGDLMYGVVGIDGATPAGPLMVTLNGTASSLLIDGFAGYRLAGDNHSVLSIEARGGVRYQRTTVAGSVDVGGDQVAQTDVLDAGRDVLAGARMFIRPFSWFYVSSTVDVGVFGSSNRTWSASADASLRLTSHVLLSLGWRTLTIDRAHVSMVMHGPRAAVQLLF